MSQKLISKPPIRVYDLATEYAKIETELVNPQTQEQIWTRMVNELEIANFPKTEISSIIRKIIEDKIWELKFKDDIPREKYSWHSGHFYRIMKKLSCGNPFFNRSAPSEGAKNSSINTQMPQVIEDLLGIYIETQSEIHEFIKKLGSEFHVFNLYSENEVDSLESELLSLKEEPKTNSEKISMLQSKLESDKSEKKKLYDAIHSLKAFKDILKSIRDEKMKITLNTIHILLYSLATEASVSYGAEKFFVERIRLISETRKQILTPKQATKFQKGERNLELEIFNPKTRDMAIFHGYYGIPCPGCKSFRVKIRSDSGNSDSNLICRNCELAFKGSTAAKCRYCQIPLYKEELQHIIKTWKINEADEDGRPEHKGDPSSGGHCPNCNMLNHLPAELIEYAKS